MPEPVDASTPTAYLIRWETLTDGGTTTVESEAELVGYLLGLPDDGTMVVCGVSEVNA